MAVWDDYFSDWNFIVSLLPESWREVNFLYMLFVRALFPEELSLRVVLKNWNHIKLKLSERPLQRISASANMKYVSLMEDAPPPVPST